MRAPRFVDMTEAAPGVWCDPSEVELVRAAQPALDDLTKNTRPRTPADVPNIGTPAEFYALVVVLFAAAYLFG